MKFNFEKVTLSIFEVQFHIRYCSLQNIQFRKKLHSAYLRFHFIKVIVDYKLFNFVKGDT